MLPSAARLKHSRDFQAVYQRRRSFGNENLTLFVRARGTAPNHPTRAMMPDRHVTVPPRAISSRVGIVISKKTAKRAHDRNRLKRRLREICRLKLLPNLKPDTPYDLLLVARSAAVKANFQQLTEDVDSLSRQAHLM